MYIVHKLFFNSQVHLLCSIDHINAPLIWDQLMIAKFNFIWFDTTSFLPYIGLKIGCYNTFRLIY